MWVPIVENNEIGTMGANYFVEKNMTNLLINDPEIDTIILGCTHYPLLIDAIRKYIPGHINIVDQGPIVAAKLRDYLSRHPEMEKRCSMEGNIVYLTTEQSPNFENKATIFMDEKIAAETIHLT